MKRLTLSLLLTFFAFIAFSQEKLGCETPIYFQKQLEEMKKNGAERGPLALWIDEGYGAACAHGCANTHVPVACGGNTTYRVPVKIWLFADDNGSNQLVTPAIAATHLAYVNTYFACQGIPVSFYQVANSPTLVLSTDLNDFDATSGDGDDAFVRANNYQTNVINMYVPKALNGPGCNGYAYLPTNSSDVGYSAIMMDGSCYQNVANVCADPAWAVVLIHELGHSLGLYHTHNPYEVGASPAVPLDECPDGSNACTAGDFIADTDADPNYSSSCVTKTGCNITGITCVSPCATPYSTTANTENNIMSYNNNIGCRLTFSACQKTKMTDCLFQTSNGGRNYLCDANVERHFSSNVVNNANSPYKEICAGDAIPTFNAISACYDWYTAPSGGSAVASNSATFTPTSAQLGNNTPGTYYFYIQEKNSYNAVCRQVVSVKVSSKPGSGTPSTTTNITGSANISLNTSGASLAASGELVGWWVKSTPTTSTTFADQAALNSALSAATVGGTVGAAPNNLFASTTGTPKTAYTLPVTCTSAMVGQTYYATPFASKGGTSTPTCNNTLGISSGTSGSGAAARFATIAAAGITCRAGTPTVSPTFTVTLVVSGYTGAANNLIIFRKTGSCSGSFAGSFVSGNGTFTVTQAGFAAGTDPGVTGLCFMVAENGTAQGMAAATLTASIVTNYTYNLSFPDATLNPCTFGTPVAFVCAAALPISLIDFRAKQNDKSVLLNWETASERDNDFYTISRAADGLNFNPIATVKGNNNSISKINYELTDKIPLAGLNYYRLEQTDTDGRKSLVSTLVVDVEKATPLQIIPNPVVSSFVLHYFVSNAQNLQALIYNNVGQLVQTQQLDAYRGNNNSEIDVTLLASGLYHLVLSSEEGKVQQANFVVR